MGKTVLAIGAHPDDIEFKMAGTLLLLKKMGWDIHYMTLSDGCLGTQTYSYDEIIKIRRDESMKAANFIGAKYYESVGHDLEIFYTDDLIRKATAVVRQANPDIVLTHPIEDYMEDHMNTGRVVSTAAFARGVKNYITTPPVDPIGKDVTLYHCMPHGLKTRLRQLVTPDYYVNVESVMEEKRQMLTLHASQEEWLQFTQGADTIGDLVEQETTTVGSFSSVFKYAEGWFRHLHVGYSGAEIDPLKDALSEYIANTKK